MSNRLMILCTALLLSSSTGAEAQTTGTSPDPYSSRIMLGPESYTWQSARGTNQQNPRMAASYGNQSARSTAKPFNTVVNQPTVSPYMNLYRDQTAVDIPNYHMFVLPQQQQSENNAQQQRMMNRMQQRVQQATYAAPMTTSPAPTNSPYSRSARYGDTRHYYPSLVR